MKGNMKRKKAMGRPRIGTLNELIVDSFKSMKSGAENTE